MKTEDSIHEIMGWTDNNKTVQLLEALDETRPISKAARQVVLQYKCAWQKLGQINNILPFQLIIKKTAGSGEEVPV